MRSPAALMMVMTALRTHVEGAYSPAWHDNECRDHVTGMIPGSIGLLTPLEELALAKNNITGECRDAHHF